MIQIPLGIAMSFAVIHDLDRTTMLYFTPIVRSDTGRNLRMGLTRLPFRFRQAMNRNGFPSAFHSDVQTSSVVDTRVCGDDSRSLSPPLAGRQRQADGKERRRSRRKILSRKFSPSKRSHPLCRSCGPLLLCFIYKKNCRIT